MRKFSALVGLVLAGSAIQTASAQANYNFNVEYSGGGNAALAPGSDDPVGVNILPGDAFLWTIQAINGGYWHVTTGGDFFPLMAFAVNEPGTRIGDYALTLYRNSVSVFSLAEFGAVNNYVHLGSNTVTLPTGLDFDNMELTYLLQSAVDDPRFGGDPQNPLPINSTIQPESSDPQFKGRGGMLPIFGPPELNTSFPGIDYQVSVVATPEPATFGLMVTGLGVVGAAVRRRRRTVAAA